MAFTASLSTREGTAIIELEGELDASTAPAFREKIDSIDTTGLHRLVLDMTKLAYMSSAGLRTLVFARQKMGEVEIVLVGVNDVVGETINLTGFNHSVVFADRVTD